MVKWLTLQAELGGFGVGAEITRNFNFIIHH